MRPGLAALAALIALVPALAAPPHAQAPLTHVPPAAGISPNVYGELAHYARYASAVYQTLCPRPLGNTLVASFTNLITHAHGFVARDDARRELVLVFRGSHELLDVLTDGNFALAPLTAVGAPADTGARVHAGFQIAYDSVARAALRALVRELAEARCAGYALALAGHSMGGALAALAALAVRAHIPGVARVRLFTFGQPRMGDVAFAELLEAALGRENIFRGVHTWDGVPTMVPRSLGYRHFANEYWQFEEPPNASTVRRCASQEDPECSRSIPSTGINPAHGVYFGQVMTMDATLCL
ncbi:Alpha/Beta hydrolase protein [Gloeopeniophorella convolvens]|nr:Alpha/Beta hydrolase protein [Gloeopeniophorella convolvens]